MVYKIRKYLFLIASLTVLAQANAQVSRVEYGKNRIQYHDDFDQWLFYESENFITYWYGKARNHGVSTVKYAEQDHDEILDIIEHRINDKIEIIVYSDVSDLKQSNIGSDETFQTTNDQTKIEGSKIFVNFNGDHEELRRQIRKGIATVFLNNMFFGSNLQEIVQNSVSGNVPPWFQEGLADYVGNYWNFENDDELRNIFYHERRTNFKKLSTIFPRIVGQSLWYYIGLTYGKSEISNLLYLTRINRSVEDAFLYVFGIPFEDIGEQWEAYFKERYTSEKEIFKSVTEGERIKYKGKKRVPISDLTYSPDGRRLAIVDNQIGKTRVVLKDLETGASKKIFKHGYRNNAQATDYNYPQVAWLPDGTGLYILYEFRDNITIQFIDFNEGTSQEQFLPERYERVYSITALSSQELVFSALSQGMVDLFYYTTNNRQSNQLTRDIYDDRDVTMATVDGVKGIIFSSNRPNAVERRRSVDTLLPFANFNLFHLAFEEEGAEPKIYQITDQLSVDLTNPQVVGTNKVVYLSSANGIVNRKEASIARIAKPYKKIVRQDAIELVDAVQFQGTPDTGAMVTDTMLISYQTSIRQLTNYVHNLEQYALNEQRGVVAESFQVDDEYMLFEKDLGEGVAGQKMSAHNKLISEQKRTKKPTKAKSQPKEQIRPRQEVIRSSNEKIQYLFQSKFGDMSTDKAKDLLEESRQDIIVAPKTTVQAAEQMQADTQPINRLRIVPYQLKFKLHSLSTNMDNSLLFGGLDSYSAFKPEYEPVPVGILIKANFKDLFEDYVFEGGVRIPTAFNGTEYFLTFDDKKRRLDRQYAVYRRTTTDNVSVDGQSVQRTRANILLGQFSVRYPIDIYQSLRATATLRQDKTTFLASDRSSLNNPDLENQRAGVKLEYVFDNSLDIDLNIRSGIRFKIFAEVVKKFDFNIDPLSLKLAEGFMTVLGTDARHYLNFAKHSVLASRFAAGTSFGSERILYYLGGSDNWLIPKFNEDIQPPSGNFAFQTISPNLRGFDYNIRNGSTFALLNAEVRIPFLKYLSRRPIRISFFRHLQVVGFADVGVAWEGLSPFDEDNPINLDVLRNPPTVLLQVNYYRDPLVFGYGVGLRTLLFGYFIRVDYAWGVQTGIVQKPKLHLSMGLDF